jgi:hypothetical protein
VPRLSLQCRLSSLWVPVNKGETGSKLAIKKAKSAARQLGITQHDFPYAPELLQSTIQSVLHEQSEDEWRQEKKSQITKLFFPTARDAVILQRSLINHQTTQILTCHRPTTYWTTSFTKYGKQHRQSIPVVQRWKQFNIIFSTATATKWKEDRWSRSAKIYLFLFQHHWSSAGAPLEHSSAEGRLEWKIMGRTVRFQRYTRRSKAG